jgi:hypothetical protein
MTVRSWNEAKPGSAWDTWQKAGREYAQGKGPFASLESDHAAACYAATRKMHGKHVIKAFIEGYEAEIVAALEHADETR